MGPKGQAHGTKVAGCIPEIAGEAVSLLDQTDKIQVQQDNIEEAVYVEDQQAPYITWQSCLPYEKS
jgi:hypothetical protein